VIANYFRFDIQFEKNLLAKGWKERNSHFAKSSNFWMLGNKNGSDTCFEKARPLRIRLSIRFA
jgi:hypothetical protein